METSCRNRSPLVRLPLETHSRDVPSSQCSRDLSRSSISSCPFSLCVENFDVTHVGCLGIKAHSQPTKLHRERERENSILPPLLHLSRIGVLRPSFVESHTSSPHQRIPPNYHPPLDSSGARLYFCKESKKTVR